MLKNAWLGKSYISENGNKVKQAWIYDDNYSSWFYLQQDGTYAENGWLTIDGRTTILNQAVIFQLSAGLIASMLRRVELN